MLVLGVALVHQRFLRGDYQSFSRVWAHFGLLDVNLALWFLSLFGVFEEHAYWDRNGGERFVFTVLWALVSGASIYAGARYGMRMLRGYGMTFLLINTYTAYFQFLAVQSGGLWFLHLLLVGGSLVGVGVSLDHVRKQEATA